MSDDATRTKTTGTVDLEALRYVLLSEPRHLRELASGMRSRPVSAFHQLAEVLEACAWRIEHERDERDGGVEGSGR